jgi:transposase-like protein
MKNKAIKLRKEGKSYSEIKQLLNVPKSTLSDWLKNIKISKQAKDRLKSKSSVAGIKALIKHNKTQTVLAKERAKNIQKGTMAEIMSIDKTALKLIGTALYLGEGGKTGNRVDFTNSNPQIIEVIMKFFREVCNVKTGQFIAQLAIHDEKLISEAKEYWSKLTGIPKGQFIKVSLAVSKYSKKRRKNRLPYGTIQIRICDVKLFNKIQGWIYGILKNLEIIVPG